MGATNETLKSIVDAVIACHRDAQLPSPVSGDLAYQRLTGCLARVLGTQRSHKMGVTRDMFVHLLRACSWIWPAPAYALGVLRRLGLGHAAPSASPLFPKLSRQTDGSWALHWSPTPSSGAIYAMVVAALSSLGVDTTAFPGVSCRMGGLTVAIEAGVPEHILWMQSGHAQDRAARRYVRLTNPDRLYDTWRAFRL